ncbi:prokaryotic type I DNA topoisomerase [Auriculariales sp. MPI-PUGE-AT-0066]|nr:prokaryotic type I DNA topoisomerase [Auriculariales sp. MPI-PUGE-AT-0066]
MKVLCVAEKPSIAKAISQILGGGAENSRVTGDKYTKNWDFPYAPRQAEFTVTAVRGHLLTHDFTDAYRKWHSCDPLVLFDAEIVSSVSADLRQVERNLVSEARSAQVLMIWTDCDREGENIGAEVVEVCRKGNRNIRVQRARFSAIIPAQIHRAAQNPVELDYRQASAVDARTLLDLRFGAAFTRLQTLTLQASLPDLDLKLVSYGERPCQFPTLGFVVSRYEQVQSFRPEQFWHIFMSATRRENGRTSECEFHWRRGHLFEFPVALVIYELVLDNPIARVAEVNSKPTKKWLLQKAGSRLLRLAPKKVLDVAEKLYQKGFLSYPRTETDIFDSQFQFKPLIEKHRQDDRWGTFATSLLNDDGFSTPRRGRKDDKAHPPIHPTANASNLTGDEKRVYEFITRRFLACCSKDAEGMETTVRVTCSGEEFSAAGLTVVARNYLDVYPYDKWGDKHIPLFQEGEEFIPSVCELREGQTSSPSLLTEADLVSLMDKNGIGTDATIAQHIQTIVDREYVMERTEGSVKYLVPSTLGIALVEGYNRIGFDKSLSKPQLRRDTERDMVRVCEGEKNKDQMMREAIEQYRAVFVRTREQFGQILECVRERVHGAPVARGGDRAARRGGGGGGGGWGGGPGGGRGGGGAPGPPPAGPPGGRGHPPRCWITFVTLRRCSTSSSATKEGVESFPVPTAASIRPNTNAASPRCNCDIPAAQRTVTKDNENQGRQFWACGKDRACDFFVWADGVDVGGDRGGGAAKRDEWRVPAKRPSSTQGDPGLLKAARMCGCDLTAVSRTVGKDGPTKGRKFWSCPNAEGARCGFFVWDEADSAEGAGNSIGSRNSGGPRSGECYKCGEPGHWSSNCPKAALGGGGTGGRGSSQQARGGGGSRDGECYKCGQTGHWSSDCPGGGSGSNYSSSRGGRTAPKRGGRSKRSSSTGQKRGTKRTSKFAAAEDEEDS